MFQNLSTQQKGSLLAFVGVMFITPDSLFIRLASIETWSLLFYRGAITFIAVFLSLLIIYKSNFFKISFFIFSLIFPCKETVILSAQISSVLR